MKQRTPSDCPLFLRMMLGELGFGPWNEKDLTDIEKAAKMRMALKTIMQQLIDSLEVE